MTVAGIGVAMGMELFLEQLPWRPEEWPVQGEPLTTEADSQAASAEEVPTLGIPTVRDRVVQCAVKNILEPIFEELASGMCRTGFDPDEAAMAPWSTSA